MTLRREFPTTVRVAVLKRATTKSVIYCESCHLPAKRYQIDHIIPDKMGGEPVLENAELICDVCYGVKNPEDTRNIAKAKRREATHIGANKSSRIAIHSRGFTETVKRKPKQSIPPRALYKNKRSP